MNTGRAFLCSCLTLLACVPAAAQTQQPTTRPERPYRGVFASGVDETGQSLTATTSLSAGYDDNIFAEATQQASPTRSSQQGTLGQFSGSLAYGLIGTRAQLRAGAGTSLRYYPSLENKYFETYNATLGGSVSVFTKPLLTLHQSVSYQPYTFLTGVFGPGLLPDAEVPVAPEPDFVPIASQYVVHTGGADLNAKLTRRTSFLTTYSYRVSDQTSRNFLRQTATTGFMFGLTRDLSLRTMYRYTAARYPGRTLETHSPDVGLDFSRGLSLTRRTSLTFGVGTEVSVVRDETRYRATGHVNVLHEIGRSWSALGTYSRGAYYLDTLEEPLFGDTLRASVGGLITRRLQVNLAASGTVGNAGFAADQQYDSYRGTAALSMALNRFMNVGVDYAYYRYMFDPTVVLAPGVPHNVNRQSVRAHVSLWAPLLNRTRSRDASR